MSSAVIARLGRPATLSTPLGESVSCPVTSGLQIKPPCHSCAMVTALNLCSLSLSLARLVMCGRV